MDMIKYARLMALTIGLLGLLYSQSIYATQISINTDSTWRSYDTYQAGWNTVGFDDDNWRHAYEPYTIHPDPEDFPNLVNAQTIWDWPSNTIPDGSSGPDKAYFRYELVMPGLMNTAQFSYAVDDALILYINGIAAYTHVGAGNTNTPDYHVIDHNLFTSGLNIIAIEAWDGSDYGVWNRGGESLTANFLLEVNQIPDPHSILLLLSGVVGLFMQRKRAGS